MSNSGFNNNPISAIAIDRIQIIKNLVFGTYIFFENNV